MIVKWKHKYFEHKINESHAYILSSLEIKHYMKQFLKSNNLILHDYRINFSGSFLNVFISYYSSIKYSQNKNNQQKYLRSKKKTYKPKVIPKYFLKLKKKNFYKKLCKFNDYVKLNAKRLEGKKKLLFLKYLYKHPEMFTMYPYKYRTEKQIKYFKNLYSLIRKNKNLKINSRKMLRKYFLNIFTNKTSTIYNIIINNFIEKFIESLSLFIKKKYNIIITFKQLNKSRISKKRLRYIKHLTSHLRKFSRNNHFFSEGINVMYNALTNKNSAKLLAIFIKNAIKNLKRHNFFIAFLIKSLTYLIKKKLSKIHGIKIIIKGRLNNRPRARFKRVLIGKIPLITKKTQINYAKDFSHGRNGTIGIKVWISEK